MKRVVIAALVGFAAASCGPPIPVLLPPTPPSAATPPTTPIQTPRPQQPARPTPTPPPDHCGAQPLQYLIGKPRSAIPVPVDVRSRRVTCTSCPVTMDYREDRLNIFFDAETGIIKEVKCG